MTTKNVIKSGVTLAVAGTAIGLSSASTAITENVTGAIITLETAQIRWTADGTTPSSTVGHLMYVGDTLNFTEGNWSEFLKRLQFCRTTSTSGALIITYLRNS